MEAPDVTVEVNRPMLTTENTARMTTEAARVTREIRSKRAGVFQRFLDLQQRMSAAIDRLLPDSYRVDGAYDFMDHIVPAYVPRNGLVYDVGGGKHPVLSPEQKSAASVRVVGLDISAEELSQAPDGCYDEV